MLLVPFAAGLLFFGFRALLCVAVVMLLIEWFEHLRRKVRIGLTPGLATFDNDAEPRRVRVDHEPRRVRVDAALLALLMPPGLAAWSGPGGTLVWPVLVCAASCFVLLRLATARLAIPGVVQVTVTLVILHTLFAPLMLPDRILASSSLGIGDVVHSSKTQASSSSEFPIAVPEYFRANHPAEFSAIQTSPVTHQLQLLPTGASDQDARTFLAFSLPGLSSLITGASPNFLGTASASAIIGATFLGLSYLRRIDPITCIIGLILLYAAATFTEFLLRPAVDWPARLTVVHYQLLSGTALFVMTLLVSRDQQLVVWQHRLAVFAAAIAMPIVAHLTNWAVAPLIVVAISMAAVRPRST